MKKKQILMVGGGSGGHVTPLLAIAQELQKNAQTNADITLITDRSFFAQTALLTKDMPLRVKKIYAGKYRRYHGKSLLWHLSHLPTVWGNIRDILLLGLGGLQSFWYFLWHRPDVVFCKGGYVCVPVGIVAHLWRIPLIIHDSDTHPGLTNRFLSRWAQVIATGMPPAYYQYPKSKMVYTGIPVNDAFRPTTTKEQQRLRAQHGLSKEKPILLITGGGTGAASLNTACAAIAEKLLQDNWEIVHFTGKGKGSEVVKARAQLSENLQRAWHIHEFADIIPYVQMADSVVSRAGATAMQEFANAKKSVIVVPNPYLTGGHQTKNAAMFKDANAVEVISHDELTEDPNVLYRLLQQLHKDKKYATQLADALYQAFAKPQAAAELADIIARQISADVSHRKADA